MYIHIHTHIHTLTSFRIRILWIRIQGLTDSLTTHGLHGHPGHSYAETRQHITHHKPTNNQTSKQPLSFIHLICQAITSSRPSTTKALWRRSWRSCSWPASFLACPTDKCYRRCRFLDSWMGSFNSSQRELAEVHTHSWPASIVSSCSCVSSLSPACLLPFRHTVYLLIALITPLSTHPPTHTHTSTVASLDTRTYARRPHAPQSHSRSARFVSAETTIILIISLRIIITHYYYIYYHYLYLWQVIGR